MKTDSRSNAEHLARVEVTGGERGASMEQTGGAGGGGDPESTALGTFGCGLSVKITSPQHHLLHVSVSLGDSPRQSYFPFH